MSPPYGIICDMSHEKHRIYMNKYRQTERGAALCRHAIKKFYENPGNREARKAQRHAYYMENRDKILKSMKEYRSTEKVKAARLVRFKKYRKTQKGKCAGARVAAKRRLQIDTCNLTAKEWNNILTTFLHCCAYCGRSDVRLTQDHVLPLSKGGAHSRFNVAPACQPCNSKKSNFVPAGVPTVYSAK